MKKFFMNKVKVFMKKLIGMFFFMVLVVFPYYPVVAQSIQEREYESKISDQFKGVWIGDIEVDIGGITSSYWDEDKEEWVKENEIITIKLEIIEDKVMIHYLYKYREWEASEKDEEWRAVELDTGYFIFEGNNLVYTGIVKNPLSTEVYSFSVLNKRELSVFWLSHKNVLNLNFYESIADTFKAQKRAGSGTLLKESDDSVDPVDANVGAEGIERPSWIIDLPENKDGIIYFRGYSESGNSRRAISNAEVDFVQNMRQDGILYPIPKNSGSRTQVNINQYTDTGAISIRATFYNLKIIDMWIDSDEGIYVLCSCAGVEIPDDNVKKTEEKPIGEMDSLELYLHSLDLEKQVKEAEARSPAQ